MTYHLHKCLFTTTKLYNS